MLKTHLNITFLMSGIELTAKAQLQHSYKKVIIMTVSISIVNADTLDTFVRRVAPHTSIPVTRLKTAIAKAFGYSHIKAFEAALNAQSPTPAPQVNALSTSEQYAIEQLKYWLEDNVDQGTDIAFDNDEEIFSEQVLAALNTLLSGQPKTPTAVPGTSDIDPLVDEISASLNQVEKDVRKIVLNLAEVDSVSQIDSETYDNAEDAFFEEAERLFDADHGASKELAKGLALLRRNGLVELASALQSAHLQYHVMDFLRSNT